MANRVANFTSAEVSVIREMCSTHKDVLFGAFNPEVTNFKKKETWEDIAEKVRVCWER